VNNLKVDKQNFEEAEKFFGGTLNYKWLNGTVDTLGSCFGNDGEEGEKVHWAIKVGFAPGLMGVAVVETAVNIFKAPFSAVAVLL
jgi:hypothetical protein